MELVARTETKLNLVPLVLPFAYRFSFKKKKGVTKDWWFTPSGEGKIWVGALHTETVGKITDAEYKALCKEMKKAKADALYNDRGYYKDAQRPYTFTNDGVVECVNLNSILVDMDNEYEARREYEEWESLCETPFGK